MNELSRPETRFDAFLFASLCETNEMTLSVLSLLARQDIDPWQEANRLTQLSGAEAVNSLAARIWKSDSEQWSPSEANMLAARLIKLLPSHNHRSTPPWTGEGGRLSYWMVAWIVFMSITIYGNNMQNAKHSGASADGIGMHAREDGVARSFREIGTD